MSGQTPQVNGGLTLRRNPTRAEIEQRIREACSSGGGCDDRTPEVLQRFSPGAKPNRGVATKICVSNSLTY